MPTEGRKKMWTTNLVKGTMGLFRAHGSPKLTYTF